MEQEPVYVPSKKLEQVCTEALAKIYDLRQRDKESYVLARVQAYNHKVLKDNRLRRLVKIFGVKPKMQITPYGMELLLVDEVRVVGAEHPMCNIHTQYGGLEHETKDAMVQCKLNDAVAISGPMVRGLSHLGLSLEFMQRPRFGFYPR